MLQIYKQLAITGDLLSDGYSLIIYFKIKNCVSVCVSVVPIVTFWCPKRG